MKGARIVWGDASYENTEVTARLFARGRAQPAGVVVDDVTGSIIMKGRLGDQAWQGELSVEEAYGSRKMGRVDATLALSTLAPVAAMPPLERRVPDLAEALLDLDDAKAVARAQWEGEDLRFILDELEIDSGTITAWLLVGSGPVRGAIHASLPLISVGVTLADGRSDVTLSPGDDWLRRYLNPGIERPPPPRSALPEPTN